MRTPAFTRIKPDSTNMVTEPCSMTPDCIDILCVECSWQGHAGRGQAPWVVFKDHLCRLITESISS